MTLKPLPDRPTVEEYQFTQPLEDAYRQVGETVQGLIDKFNAGVQHVYDKRFFLGPLLFAIKNHLDTLRAGLDKLVQLVRYAVEHHLPVLSLIVQSFRWLTKVQSPMSDLSAPTTEARNPDLEYWSGGAASLYWKKVNGQKGAIEAVTVKAAYISKWLMDIASANVDFMVKLAQMAVDILSKFVVVGLEGASVIGIPFAADTLAKEAGGILAKGINQLIEIANRFMKSLSDARDIVSEVGDHTKLTEGKWPQAVYL